MALQPHDVGFGIDALIAQRMSAIDASGIRRIFDLAAGLRDPINLSIGQPHFAVPQPIQDAAAAAIRDNRNGYTPTQGIKPLIDRIWQNLDREFGWQPDGPRGLFVTSGVSGGLLLAMMTTINPGDEVIFADPYFVMYQHLVTMAGGKSVIVSSYPDFALPVDAIEAAMTERTKVVLINTPSNPTGSVATADELQRIAAICRQRGVLLISDEIYDLFTYGDFTSAARFDTAANGNADPAMLLLRGFSKTYGLTGWRLGYAVGPQRLINEMAKLQQFTFVCAPHPFQLAAEVALDVDMSEHVADYAQKRCRLIDGLRSLGYRVPDAGGGFYLFPETPAGFASATAFVEEAIANNLLIIPGSVFSRQDTNFRISYAASDETIDRGLEVFAKLMR